MILQGARQPAVGASVSALVEILMDFRRKSKRKNLEQLCE
jgi:hypothetical protein